MRYAMAYCFASFAVILITHETIFPVNGQCTTQGCDNRDPLISIVAEIRQLRDDLFNELDKQVQSIREHLNATLEEIKSQHQTVNRSLQAVDRRLLQQAVYIQEGHSFNEHFNKSLKEMKSLQAVEHETCMKHVQSIHEILNASFEGMKNQHDTANKSMEAIDRRRLEEHEINLQQGRSIYELLNSSFLAIKNQYETINVSLQGVDRCPREYDIYSTQFHSVQKILNQSFQEIRNHHDSVESRIYINQSQRIHELINVSFHEIKNQHDTVLTSFQAVDQRLKQHDITMRIRTQNLWRLTNGTCESTSHVCDCSYLKASGLKTSGVYEVCVRHQTGQLCSNAFCDMEAANDTSLVFQRRKDGSVNFNRTWAEYKDGFGNPNGEFWLGNEMLNLLTSKRNYKLRVDLEDFNGTKAYAEYSTFSISSSSNNYTLTVMGYSGSAGECMAWNNGSQFSTIDAHNDKYRGKNCAGMNGGAWWYHYCSYASLNSKYHQRHDTVQSQRGIMWYYWKNSWTDSLKATEMKLVPVA